jgi:dTDP-4-dehydrorhamnose reductase
MKILVIGASGLIGSSCFSVLSEEEKWTVFGTLRSAEARRHFRPDLSKRLIAGVDVLHHDVLTQVFNEVRPNVVINCVGLTKHHVQCEDPLVSVPLNAILPHRLARMSAMVNARLVHVSTDCVFTGARGGYLESDKPDSDDTYGRTKILGEVITALNAVTLRTSTIGHELQSSYGLLNWFLAQEGKIKGFRKAIFSGLPSFEFARVIRDVVIPRGDLNGLYHVAADPIDKYSLLQMIAAQYGKSIEIEADDSFQMDRSLNSERFHTKTGYQAPSWRALISMMHSNYMKRMA